jgi:hypothetical protein
MTDLNTSERDAGRVIRSWLHEDRHEDASRIAGAVLDQVEATPQRRVTWWPARRTPTMNKIVTFGLAAAAVVAAVFIGVQLFGSPDGGFGADPTQTPTPEITPSPSTAAGLPEGPFMITAGQADDPVANIPPLTVTIPAPDWYGEPGGGILLKNDVHEPPAGSGMIVFAQPEFIVYGDACQWQTSRSTVTTVDEFVAALSSQDSREASEPVDITLGEYTGQSLTLEVPAGLDFGDCDPGYGGSWDCSGTGAEPCGYHSGAGEIDTVYLLDVDGVIVAWTTKHYAGTPPDDVAEMEAIVQSASFGD